jgi:hypothetical protein
VLLELADEQHLAALQRTLNEWPLANYVEFGGVIGLPRDSEVSPEALSAKRCHDKGQPAENERYTSKRRDRT